MQDRFFDLRLIVQNDLGLFAYSENTSILEILELIAKRKETFGLLKVFKIDK